MLPLVLLALAVPPSEARPLLELEGNEALNGAVYRAILDLPEGTRATTETAATVRERLTDFLHRAGYDLATVAARVAGDHLRVIIDEGHVDKVIVLGQGAVETLRVKLELSMPYNVFNRPALEEQLDRLAKRHQLVGVRWELVPVLPVEHVGPQLESLGTFQSFPILPPSHPYELHILLHRTEWETGLSPDLRVDSLEGLGAGVRWRAQDLLLDGDRFEVRGRLAGNLRRSIDLQSTHVVLSRAIAELRWFTPPFVGRELRSFFAFRGDLLNRQREDLGLESFYFAPFDGSANLELTLLRELTLSAGFGVQHRILLTLGRSTTLPVSAEVDAAPASETRVFGLAGADLVLNPDELRRDRRHELLLDLRVYGTSDAARGTTLRLGYAYQKTFLFGWHELWVKSRGAWLAGEVTFTDDEAIGGNYLRGPFVDRYYARKLGSVGLEARFSVTRDLFKIGVFNDAAAFGLIDPRSGASTFTFADAFGLGLHALLLDAFAIDAYFGLGVASQNAFDYGVLIEAEQAF